MLEIWYNIHKELIKAIKILEEKDSLLLSFSSGDSQGEFNLNALANEDFQGIKDNLLSNLHNYEKLIIGKIQDSLKERSNDPIPKPLVVSDICSG